MSDFGGVASFQGSEVPGGKLGHLARTMRSFDAGVTRVTKSGVGMLYSQFPFTPEDLRAMQPLANGEILVAFDGRLDNREELSADIQEDLNPESSDAEFALFAYRRWGAEFCGKLRGDFAVALWDGASRRLLLARDPFGLRPLFFVTRSGYVMWASTADALAAVEDSRAMDKRFVASYLAWVADERRSAFAKVSAVPPGHYVLFDGYGASRTVRYWSFERLLTSIRHKSDAEYEEHFRAVFSDAVRVRMRAIGSVTAELSGGLDSSSIACMASSVLGESTPARLRTLSFVYPNNRRVDESSYIAAVERVLDCPHFHLEESDETTLRPPPDERFLSHPSLLTLFPGKARGPFRFLSPESGLVILSGEIGDAAFRNEELYPTELAMLLFRQPFRKTIGGLWRWAESEHTTFWNMAWQAVARPLSFRSPPPPPEIPPWLAPSFISAAGLLEHRAESISRFSEIKEPHRARHCASLASCRSGLATGTRGYLGASAKRVADVRYPYLDTILLQYLLSVPPDQLWRPNERRSIQRRSMKGLLPDVVRQRITKAEGSGWIQTALNANWALLEHLVSTSLAVDAGVVIAEPLMSSLQRCRNGLSTEIGQLLRFFSVELWLRDVAGEPRFMPATGRLQAASSR